MTIAITPLVNQRPSFLHSEKKESSRSLSERAAALQKISGKALSRRLDPPTLTGKGCGARLHSGCAAEERLAGLRRVGSSHKLCTFQYVPARARRVQRSAPQRRSRTPQRLRRGRAARRAPAS